MNNLSSMISGVASTDSPLSNNHNPMEDFEIVHSPDDAVTCLAFSPLSITPNLLIAGSCDSNVKCYEIQSTGNSIPRLQQSMTASVLDVAWSADGSKVFMAGADKMAKCWDIPSNQCIQVAAHDAPIKTCHWIKSSNYNCLMTGSLDKTVKLWDLRVQQPVVTLQLPEEVYCSDVDGPVAVVSTAGRKIFGYLLETNPPQVMEITLQNVPESENRCISIFQNMKGEAHGFAVGSFGGQVLIHNFNTPFPNLDNFQIQCHPSTSVNAIKFHPKHGTMATAGSDGAFAFWDKDKRKNLKTSLQMQQPVTSCSISHDGLIFAYSVGYDWVKAEHMNNPEQKKSHIFLRPCFEEMKPQ